MSDPGHDKKDKEKKPLSKVLIGFSVGILMMMVFFMLTGVTLPMAGDALAGAITNTGKSVGNVGHSLGDLKLGLRSFGYGFSDLLVEGVLWAARIGLMIFILKMLVGLFGKKKEDDHGHGGEHKKDEAHH